MLSALISTLRNGAWLTPERASGYLKLLAFLNFASIVLAVCRAHGWLIRQEPHLSSEFMSFFAAGRQIDSGAAAEVYAPGIPVAAYIHSLRDALAHTAMQQALSGDPHIVNFAFYYPPVFWFICAPLALLPFYPAFLLWVTLSGGFLLCALRGIMGDWRSLRPVLAYFAIIENAIAGENAFLTAGLLGCGLWQLECRPVLAGLLFGALCTKPHFLLPVGIMLLAGRQWRAIAGALLSAAALTALSIAAFGWQPWFDYFTITVPHANYVFRHGGFSYAIQATPFSAIRLLGGGLALADAAQTITTVFATAALYAARRATPNIRAAMLAASFPLICPVLLAYDLTICGLAVVFLFREAECTGYLRYEKTALASMFALPLINFALRGSLHCPVDPLVVIAFMLVLLGRFNPQKPVR
jgi:hypothetical protein